MLTEMWVDRTDYHHTRVVQGDMPTPGEGEILVAIDKFAMTANNVTYAASIELVTQLAPTLLMESHKGADACDAIWQGLLRNQVSGQRGVMVSLQAQT